MDPEEFDRYIEVDDDDEKENQELRTRQPKTTDAQYIKMFEFMKVHNEGLMSKEAHNLLWESHSAELNDIGPPYHSTPEWKKIWSVKKRQCLDVESQQEVASDLPINVITPFNIVDEDVQIGATEAMPCKRVRLDRVEDVDNAPSEICNRIHIDAEISEKLSILIGKQDVIIQKLEISNNLMQEIAKKS